MKNKLKIPRVHGPHCVKSCENKSQQVCEVNLESSIKRSDLTLQFFCFLWQSQLPTRREKKKEVEEEEGGEEEEEEAMAMSFMNTTFVHAWGGGPCRALLGDSSPVLHFMAEAPLA